MPTKPRVDVWYSLQSDYCYFLLDRLIWLSQREVDVVIRPVLGIVLRMPQATKDRGEVEQRYFKTDTERTAAYLQLPYAFLDHIGRGLWNGANPNWDQSGFLRDGMARIGLQHDHVLESASWQDVAHELENNHHAMLDLGHWGVPLMAYRGEPFYGQDRFDQLLWRMGINAE